MCKRLTHIPVAEKKYSGGKNKSFSVDFRFKCQNTSVPVCSCVSVCIRTFIYYLVAQTQVKTCPSVFEEMKYNLMLNMEGFLALHSYNFITV